MGWWQQVLKRGNILDRDGNILAENRNRRKRRKYRSFPYKNAYAHIVGYNSKKYEKTGLEKKYNATLVNKQDRTPINELKKIVINPKEGNSIKLTTNSELQQYALSLLEGQVKAQWFYESTNRRNFNYGRQTYIWSGTPLKKNGQI